MSFDLKIENGNLKLGSDGDFQKVIDNEKLIQDILKIAITPVGSNIFFPWYGSTVASSLIGNPFDFQMTSTLASNQIRQALETLQRWQTAQAASGQTLTPAELLAAVQQVKVEQNQNDPRYFRVVIKALTKAFTPANTSFDIGL